jgi:endonuclease/exonuclease/phosphatase (EEP) superfamily protein YafD
LSDALAFVGAASPALLGGDLNATPDSPVYTRLAEADFVDPFVALGLGDAPTSPAVEPHQRIDFVWGRGLEPVDGAVLDSLASDHRMVITEWRLP